jgi:hypothetical protein
MRCASAASAWSSCSRTISTGARTARAWTRHSASPQFNPAIEAAFGRRNDRVPTPIAVSPRFGFSWVLGDANEISFFSGQARRPRAIVRGGIGVFASSGGGPIGTVLQQNGLPSGTQQIVCVGPAAPVPAWDLYDDRSLIPGDHARLASTRFEAWLER